MNELNNLPAGLLPVIMTVVVVGILIGVVIYCLYVKNLQDTLRAVRPQNRQMPPGQVWLLLVNFLILLAFIPVYLSVDNNVSAVAGMSKGIEYLASLISLFVLIWQFRIVQKISDSIALEYASRNMQVEAKPAYQVGLIYCIILLASLIIDFIPGLTMLRSIIGIAGLIYWILYWVKTAAYKKELRHLPEHADNDSVLFRDLY